MAITVDFAEYLQYMVNLNDLEKITTKLDQDLAASRQTMSEIKTIFNSLSSQNTDYIDNGMQHEDLSKFLEADAPKLLMPDMTESTLDMDLESIIANMKGYTEDIKKNLTIANSQPQQSRKEMKPLELKDLSTSLDQLAKCLANISLNKRTELNRNPDLEEKLTRLCQDVNMFTQIIQAKTTLGDCNKNWVETQHDSSALCYVNVINKLLSGINEVTYLLKNKN